MKPPANPAGTRRAHAIAPRRGPAHDRGLPGHLLRMPLLLACLAALPCPSRGLASDPTPSAPQESAIQERGSQPAAVEGATATGSAVDTAIAATDAPEHSPGLDRTEALIASLTIFVLAIFVGFEIITKVPPTLHTPLMSGSNAISGITLVGAVLMAGTSSVAASILGAAAVGLAMVNVAGGFLVTDRMLSMFRRK